MPLLGTFMYAGAFSLALGTNCVAHSLPTIPEWVGSTVLTATLTMPNLVSRTATSININGQGGGTNHEVLAAVFHSIIR